MKWNRKRKPIDWRASTAFSMAIIPRWPSFARLPSQHEPDFLLLHILLHCYLMILLCYHFWRHTSILTTSSNVQMLSFVVFCLGTYPQMFRDHSIGHAQKMDLCSCPSLTDPFRFFAPLHSLAIWSNNTHPVHHPVSPSASPKSFYPPSFSQITRLFSVEVRLSKHVIHGLWLCLSIQILYRYKNLISLILPPDTNWK